MVSVLTVCILLSLNVKAADLETVTADEEQQNDIETFANEIYATEDFDFEKSANISNSGYVVKSYKGTAIDVTIPDEVNGLPVVGIGNSAFYHSDIESVVIPDTVTAISNYAFSESRLKSVELSSSISFIGEHAFQGCRLESVDLSGMSQLNIVGAYAFADNRLREVKFPETQEMILVHSLVFSNNELLSAEDIYEKGVIHVGMDAFSRQFRKVTATKTESDQYQLDLEEYDSSIEVDKVVNMRGNTFEALDGSKILLNEQTTIGDEIRYEYLINESRSCELDATLIISGFEYPVVFLDYDGSEINKQIIPSGGNAREPQMPEREGYSFAGWDKEFSNINDYTIVRANWIKKVQPTYKVEFFAEKGNPATLLKINDGLHTGEAVGEKPDKNPEKKGYEFSGWSTDGTASQDKMYNKDTKIQDANIVYYAIWSKRKGNEKRFTVEFDSVGGNYTPKKQKVIEGKQAERPKDPTKEGYTFEDWYYKNKDEKEVQWNFGDAIAEDLKLTAHWKMTDKPVNPSDSCKPDTGNGIDKGEDTNKNNNINNITNVSNISNTSEAKKGSTDVKSVKTGDAANWTLLFGFLGSTAAVFVTIIIIKRKGGKRNE